MLFLQIEEELRDLDLDLLLCSLRRLEWASSVENSRFSYGCTLSMLLVEDTGRGQVVGVNIGHNIKGD